LFIGTEKTLEFVDSDDLGTAKDSWYKSKKEYTGPQASYEHICLVLPTLVIGFSRV
jgi:hypothetical protein